MIRALILVALLLAVPCTAQQLTDGDLARHRAKLTEYIGYGWPPDEIISAMRRWFGMNFEIGPNHRDVLAVWRRASGEIYYIETIGTLPER